MESEVGLAALQRSIEEGKRDRSANHGGDNFSRLGYFSWKPDEVKVVRFLTDDITQNMYAEYVVTNEGKTQSFIVDPDNNLVAKYGGKVRESFVDPGSALVEPRLVKRAAGIAVLREERRNANGQIEVVDAISERTVGNTAYPARFFGVVRQSMKNFWQTLVEYSARYGTLTDRDYIIKRVGGGLDTSYSIIPCDPVDELRKIEDIHAFYGYGQPWNPEDPDRYLKCPWTIQEWVSFYSSEERIKSLLGGSSVTTQTLASTGNDEAQAVAPKGTDFASLRERLIPHAK